MRLCGYYAQVEIQGFYAEILLISALIFIGEVTKMTKLRRTILSLSILLMVVMPTRADDDNWEYQVIILQGVTAGSTLEKQAKGVSLDTRRTRILNGLAADGWEVVSVIGGPVTDHAVYLKRKLTK
jgi:hypothetical protein